MHCGCMATRHSFFTNCAVCGAIFCEKEFELDKCHFCKATLMEKLSSNEAELYFIEPDILNAYRLKACKRSLPSWFLTPFFYKSLSILIIAISGQIDPFW